MSQYLPSTYPGKVVKVSLSKNFHGENCVVAVEGVLERFKDSPVDMFTYAPFSGDRSMRCSFGRNTKKNREHAYAVLLSDLVDGNMVPAGTSICTD